MDSINKMVTWLIVGLAVFAAIMAFMMYNGELQKNNILRSENSKTTEEAFAEVKKLKSDLEAERQKTLEEKRTLLVQVTKYSEEKEKAEKEAQEIKKRVFKERELSLVANDDLDTLRAEVAQISKESRRGILGLENDFKKKKQIYDTRILSLEAQLGKARQRLGSEAERYHYNLGVLYAQNKNYDLAVSEFKTALSYNSKSAQAHYNLGIIFDDYFKDKDNARYHYKTFLDLKPNSDDADNVKDWLAALGR